MEVLDNLIFGLDDDSREIKMPIQNFMAIHPVIVEIFQSRPEVLD